MKFLVLFLLINVGSLTSKIEDVRNKFPEINSLEETENYLIVLKNEKDETSQAYFAAMLFMKSKYVKFPLTKLNYFKKGKLLLDELVTKHQNNIEIRYIRFLLQSEMPDFLGYNKNLEEDYLAIIEQVGSYDLSSNFKAIMLNNILISKSISNQKEQKIKQLLNNL